MHYYCVIVSFPGTNRFEEPISGFDTDDPDRIVFDARERLSLEEAISRRDNLAADRPDLNFFKFKIPC